MKTKGIAAAVALPFTLLLLSACVSQQQYDAVVAENNQLKAQLTSTQAQLAASQAEQKFVEAGDYLFPSGGFQLSPAGQAELANNIAPKLKGLQNAKVVVYGFTDNAPVGPELQRQGITVTVANYLSWASLADEAAAEYRSGRTKTIILVGHSSGATALPDMVARLDQLGTPVKLAIGLDSVLHTSLTGRVGRYINFYVANGAGTPVAKTKQFHGELENVDVGRIGMGHLTIDKNEVMQQKVISAIDAVVFSRPTRSSVAQRPQQPEAAAAKPGLGAASAAVRN